MSATRQERIIRELRASDRTWAEALVREHFGSARIVSRGKVHDARALPGLVAERQGAAAGLLLYRIEDDACEVVVLIATVPRQGLGRLLLDALRPVAQAAGCRRLWLVTTNDNAQALAFYRALAWSQVAVHRGAVRAARALKPEIPERSPDGARIEDEIEFELRWENA